MIGSFNDPSIVFLINTYYIGSYHAQRTSFLLTFNTKWVNSLAVVDGILGSNFFVVKSLKTIKKTAPIANNE